MLTHKCKELFSDTSSELENSEFRVIRALLASNYALALLQILIDLKIQKETYHDLFKYSPFELIT